MTFFQFFFFSSRRRHTRLTCDWSSDVCSSDLGRSLRLTVTDGGATREIAVTPQRIAGRDIFGDEQDYWELGARQSVSDQATIGDVVPGGAAAKAGLKPADIIVSLEGQPITSWDELADGISKRAGQATVLGVKRGDQVLTLTVTPAP